MGIANRMKTGFSSFVFLLFLCLFPVFSFSQTDSAVADTFHYPFADHRYVRTSWGIIGGLNIQKSLYGELGFCKAVYGGHIPVFAGYSFSAETYVGNEFIVAPKISVLFAALLAYRVNLLYYTDFDHGSLRIRPEIGFGIGIINFLYGYNIPITHKRMPNVNEHNFSLVFFISRKIVKNGFY